TGGEYYQLALKSNGTVVAWGLNPEFFDPKTEEDPVWDFGQTHVPSGLSGVVAIAAGEAHNLALKSNGKVVAWGFDGTAPITEEPAFDYYGDATAVPADATNEVAGIAAGRIDSHALKVNGTMINWGDTFENDQYSNVVKIAGDLVLKS